MAIPRFRDEHHHGVRKRAPAHDKHFQSIVDHGRIAAAFDDNREKILDVFTKQFGFEERLASFHPIDIAAERIDLAVVRDVPEWMRERPAGECIRAEALVHHSERGYDSRIRQVREVNFDLFGRQHSLIDERAA